MVLPNRHMAGRVARGLAAGAVVVLLQVTATGLDLVDRGKPNGVIVVAQDAPDTVRLAAAELQSYVAKVTGATLPLQDAPIPQGQAGVSVFVGESLFTRAFGLNLDGLKSDGFRVVCRDNWLAILGRDYRGAPISGLGDPWDPTEVCNEKLKIGAFGETGTLYGVYWWLETYCGVRWFMPGDLGTVVPPADGLSVPPLDYRRSPDFEYRYPFMCYFPRADAESLWYRRAGFGAAYPVQIIDSFRFFLKYKDSRPEYFALIDGQRDTSDRSCEAGGGNLCLSNPEVIRQWVTEICEYFANNPQQSTFPLMPNDGMRRVCECAQCQAQVDPGAGPRGKFSNYVWTFVDAVAAGVYQKYPDRLVGCCAYEHYYSPPTRIARLHPNVAVMVCKQRGRYCDEDYRESTNRTIATWREKAGTLYNWVYYRYSNRPWTGFPVVFPQIIAEDLRAMKGISRGEFIEDQSWGDGEQTLAMNYPGMQHLNLYVTAKLLWDSSLDVDELLADYYATFYGPAAEAMGRFWTTAEAIWMSSCPQDKDARASGEWFNPINIYTRDRLDSLSSLLAEAQSKVPPGSAYRQRVDLILAEFTPARRKLTNVLVAEPPGIEAKGPLAPAQVDGVLTDDAWQRTEPVVLVDKDGEAARYRTLGYIAWDEEALCIALICYEPDIGRLKVLASQQDPSHVPAVFDDDSVEVFVSPDPAARARCYQFVVNAKGVRWDGFHGGAGAGAMPDETWESGFEAATRIEATRWTVEMRIPLRAIGVVPPVPGKRIALNLYRNRQCGQPVVYSCWSPTVDIAHYSPARFGLVTFTR